MMMSRLIDEGALSKTRKDSEEVNVNVARPVGAIGARGSTFEGGRFPTTQRTVTDRTGTKLDERSNESRRSRSKSGDRRPTRSRSRPPRRGWREDVDPPQSVMQEGRFSTRAPAGTGHEPAAVGATIDRAERFGEIRQSPTLPHDRRREKTATPPRGAQRGRFRRATILRDRGVG